jgi:hypothetical protein
VAGLVAHQDNPLALNLDLQQGTSFDWQLQALNPDDSVPTGQFLASDSVASKLWQGASDAPVFAPAISWLNATAAQYQISFNNADLVNLPLGVYYIEATATRAGRSAALLPKGSTVTLLAAPGTTTPAPTYITVIDIRSIADWIDQVSAPDKETGFLTKCAQSRSWLDENILRNYRGGNVELLGYHGLALDSWYTGGTRRTSLRNSFILDLLQQNGLIVTDRTKRICAYYALSLICEGMLMISGKPQQYLGMAARARAESERLLTCYTAELNVNGNVDVNGNLIANIPINFSSTNTLFA